MGEEFQAAEEAAAAAAAAAEAEPTEPSRLPPATPMQSGGSTGSGSAQDAPPRPSRAPPPHPEVDEENEVDEDLQEAIRMSLLPQEPTTAPTTRAPILPGTAKQPAGGSLWLV